MQLRYKDGKFSTRACSAWRLVFVIALMPWLHKFRELARPEDSPFDDDDAEGRFRLRSSTMRSSVLSSDTRSMMLMGLSQMSVGKRSLAALINDVDDDMEKSERIEQIKVEIERLQNMLNELEKKD